MSAAELVTDEMVEMAAKSALMVTQGDVDPEYAWSVQYIEVQQELLDQARAALEAAALLIAAEALEEAARDWEGLVQCEIPPVRGSVWLQRRAAQIRARL